MSENKGRWEGVGYGVDTPSQQLATIFDSILHTAVSGRPLDETAAGFLRTTEETTGLTNKILLARAAVDLNSPNGRVIVEIVNMGENAPLASWTVASMSIKTPHGDVRADKLITMVLLNTDSKQFNPVYQRGLPFRSNRNVNSLKLARNAGLQILQAVITNQVELETAGPGTYMTRTEYFAWRDQTADS